MSLRTWLSPLVVIWVVVAAVPFLVGTVYSRQPLLLLTFIASAGILALISAVARRFQRFSPQWWSVRIVTMPVVAVLFLLALILWFIFAATDFDPYFVEIDECLDDGRVWNDQRKICESG